MNKLMYSLITSFLFAGSFIAAKYASFELGPLTTSLLRYLIAIIFLSFFLIKTGKEVLVIKTNDIWKFALLGLTGIVGYHYFFFTAIRYTAIANTALINALSPLLTALMASLFIREKLSIKNYMGILLSVSGVLLLLTKGRLDNLTALKFAPGDLLMLCSVISWVIYALTVKTLTKNYKGFTITFYATLAGVILLVILAPLESTGEQFSKVSLSTVYALIYMGIGASGIGYLFYNISIDKIGPTRTSATVYSMVPVTVAILSLIFFSEKITFILLFSMIFVLTGLHLMLSKNPMRSKKSK